jgi:hypothetical protein
MLSGDPVSPGGKFLNPDWTSKVGSLYPIGCSEISNRNTAETPEHFRTIPFMAEGNFLNPNWLITWSISIFIGYIWVSISNMTEKAEYYRLCPTK